MPALPDLALVLAFALTAGLAAGWDLRERRIPRWIPAGGLALALVLRAWPGGESVGPGVAGALAGLVVGVPLFTLGRVGGGDVKLLIATGAFVGIDRFGPAILAAALAGGVLALIAAVRAGALGRTLRGAWSRLRPGQRRDAVGAVSVPYGLAIAMGGMAAWLL